MRVLSPLDLRRSLGAILDAASAGERFVIERDHRPLAMLVSVEDGRRLEPDVDEVRRRRLAALERLEALAGQRGGERDATGAPARARRGPAAVVPPVASRPVAGMVTPPGASAAASAPSAARDVAPVVTGDPGVAPAPASPSPAPDVAPVPASPLPAPVGTGDPGVAPAPASPLPAPVGTGDPGVAPAPASPSPAAPPSAAHDRHEAERSRHAGEGLVGLG